jgi:hypothetical protein
VRAKADDQGRSREPVSHLIHRNGGPPPLPPAYPRNGWTRARRAAVELTAEAIEQIAQRVAELLRNGAPPSRPGPGLLDARELASALGVSRDWVYEHAGELGVITLGDGPRPRMRFDPDVASLAFAARRRRIPEGASPSGDEHARPTRRRRSPVSESTVPLLPVRTRKLRCARHAARALRRARM